MSRIEEKLIQVNMKGSEANLAFPTELNEAFNSLSHTIEAADTAPTDAQLEVLRTLLAKLDAELENWRIREPCW